MFLLFLLSFNLCDAQRAVLLVPTDQPFLQTDLVEVMSAVGYEGVRVVHVLVADTADITVFSQLSLASRGQGAKSSTDLSPGVELVDWPTNTDDKVEEK